MNTTLCQRLLATFMAALLAVSMMPAWAFANADLQAQGATSNFEQNVDQDVGEASADATAGDGADSSHEAVGGVDDIPAGCSSSQASEDPTEAGASESEIAAASPSFSSEDLRSVLLSTPVGGESEEDVLPESEERINVTVSISGPDASGKQCYWFAETGFEAQKGDKASSVLEKALEKAGLKDGATIYGSEESWYLSSIKAPYDASLDLGWNESTGEYWQFFVNGEASDYGAGQVVLAEGDSISLSYSAYGSAAPGWVSASCEVIGVDASGNKQIWAKDTLSLREGSTAAKLSEAFFEKNFDPGTYSITNSGWWALDSVTSPFDGRVLGMVESAPGVWDYWQFFVDDTLSSFGAGDVGLVSGMSVVWMYSLAGSSLPGDDDVVLDPSAERSDIPSSWPSFVGGNANGAVTTAPTPTESTSAAWTYKYRTTGWATSDQIVVGGNVYIASAGKLMKLNGETGELLATANIGGSCQYFCRLAYADGVVIVPSDDGSLAAFAADTLACVWKTKGLGNSGYQSNAPLTIADGFVYAGFILGGSSSEGGALVCVRISDGATMWQSITSKEETGTNEGYYWAGGVSSGTELLVGGENGNVALISRATGETLASVNLGGPIRANVVAAQVDSASGDGVYLAVTRDDGTLHKVKRQGNRLTEEGSVKFAATSTSTPAVADGKVFVNGVSEGNWKTARGLLVVIDLATLQIEKTIAPDLKASQSSPLVSKQASGTYVYFTINNNPGCVYAYKYGDDEAYRIFTPDSGQQNYCTASVICDELGNLYYTNDSGYLFKLQGQPSWKMSFDTRGGSSLAALYVVKGSTALQPDDPIREGYEFAGWFVDEACSQEWSFSTPVTSDTVLYAKWSEISPVEPGEGGGVAGGEGSAGSGGNADSTGSGGNSNAGSDVNGGSSAAGTGSALGGTVAPANLPVSLEESVAEAIAEAEALEEADVDTIEAAALGARGAGIAAEDGSDAPVWAYVVLGVGVVAALGAAAWFVAARRRVI